MGECMRIALELKELKKLKKLTATEQQVVDYILDEPEEFEKLSSRQLAELTFTSPATIVRICQKLGFSGYAQFKIKYLQEINQNPMIDSVSKTNPITKEDTVEDVMNKMAALEMTAIEQTKKGLDAVQLQRVATLLERAKRIDFYAFDNNLHLAKNACVNFLCAGKMSVVHDGSNAQFMQAAVPDEHNVAIIITRTGENIYLKRTMTLLNERNIPTIVLTESRHSTLAKMGQEHVSVYNVLRFNDMGPIIFETSVKYIFNVLYAILFSQNTESILKNNQVYEDINEYHQLFKSIENT